QRLARPSLQTLQRLYEKRDLTFRQDPSHSLNELSQLPRPLIDESLEELRARRMAQLTKRLGFDLTDPLTRDEEVLSDFFESVVGLLADTETHAENLLFARREGGEHLAGLLGQVDVHHGLGRI